jgi:hypothetical protein
VSEVPAVLNVMGAPHAEQAANGLPVGGKYPAVFAEEAEGGDGLPKNDVLLRMLVLALFCGPVLGWLEAPGRTRAWAEVTSPFGCSFHSMVLPHQRRAVATLLGVFRL